MHTRINPVHNAQGLQTADDISSSEHLFEQGLEDMCVFEKIDPFKHDKQ